MTNRSSQYARDAASSRSSFSTSQRRTSREGKKDLLEPDRSCTARDAGLGTEVIHRPLANDAPVAQQNQAVADPRRVSELMNGEEQRPPCRGVLAEHPHRVARLAQIEAIEGFVQQEKRMRRQQSHRQQDAFVLAFGQLT